MNFDAIPTGLAYYMVFEIYTTHMIICGSKNHNTADRMYHMMTREAGMIFAVAKSVRRESSRQRYALQDYSYGRVSLVRGRHGWIIGSVEAEGNYYHDANDRESRRRVINLFKLLRRLVSGESPEPELFDEIKESMPLLVEDKTDFAISDVLVQFRLLVRLGYVDSRNMSQIVTNIPLREAVHNIDSVTLERLRQLCVQGLAVSQL